MFSLGKLISLEYKEAFLKKLNQLLSQKFGHTYLYQNGLIELIGKIIFTEPRFERAYKSGALLRLFAKNPVKLPFEIVQQIADNLEGKDGDHLIFSI